jgi:hypothetical protein
VELHGAQSRESRRSSEVLADFDNKVLKCCIVAFPVPVYALFIDKIEGFRQNGRLRPRWWLRCAPECIRLLLVRYILIGMGAGKAIQACDVVSAHSDKNKILNVLRKAGQGGLPSGGSRLFCAPRPAALHLDVRGY